MFLPFYVIFSILVLTSKTILGSDAPTTVRDTSFQVGDTIIAIPRVAISKRCQICYITAGNRKKATSLGKVGKFIWVFLYSQSEPSLFLPYLNQLYCFSSAPDPNGCDHF